MNGVRKRSGSDLWPGGVQLRRAHMALDVVGTDVDGPSITDSALLGLSHAITDENASTIA